MSITGHQRTPQHQRTFERNAELSDQLREAQQEIANAENARSYWESRYKSLHDELVTLCEMELELVFQPGESYLACIERTIKEMRASAALTPPA